MIFQRRSLSGFYCSDKIIEIHELLIKIYWKFHSLPQIRNSSKQERLTRPGGRLKRWVEKRAQEEGPKTCCGSNVIENCMIFSTPSRHPVKNAQIGNSAPIGLLPTCSASLQCCLKCRPELSSGPNLRSSAYLCSILSFSQAHWSFS